MISCNFGCFLRCVCLSREAEKQRSREASCELGVEWDQRDRKEKSG